MQIKLLLASLTFNILASAESVPDISSFACSLSTAGFAGTKSTVDQINAWKQASFADEYASFSGADNTFYATMTGSTASFSLVSPTQGYKVGGAGVQEAVLGIWNKCQSGGATNVATQAYAGNCAAPATYMVGVAFLNGAAIVLCSA